MIRFLTTLLLISTTFPIWPQMNVTTLNRSCTISVGPEVYHLKRVRAGGTQQRGWINGVRICFDRAQRCGWYLGGDFLYGSGQIKGHTLTGRPVVSELSDQIYEIRLGYTLQQQVNGSPFFIPFTGWGHFKEINDFFIPSPLPCTFTDTFSYVTVGFLSGVNFNSLLSIGVNLKLKFMQNGRSKVTNDPLFENVTLLMKDQINVRLDLPFALQPCNTFLEMGFLLTPFFEYRHFGGREGYPFNFRDTKFYLYGVRFALTYRF